MLYNKKIKNIGKSPLIVLFILLSSVNSAEMWKISLYNGENLACTKLYQIANDSLYTEMLGQNQTFAVNDISRMTSFKQNANIGLIGGSIAGGLLGLLIDNEEKGVTSSIIGAMGGAFLANMLTYNKSINLSKMSLNEKNNILEQLVLNSN